MDIGLRGGSKNEVERGCFELEEECVKPMLEPSLAPSKRAKHKIEVLHGTTSDEKNNKAALPCR